MTINDLIRILSDWPDYAKRAEILWLDDMEDKDFCGELISDDGLINVANGYPGGWHD